MAKVLAKKLQSVKPQSRKKITEHRQFFKLVKQRKLEEAKSATVDPRLTSV